MEFVEIDEIIPFVQKPSRYIGGEWNSVRKNPEGCVKVCLCFPDIYEIGISNLGTEILYHVINGKDGALCERAYAPWSDMEKILRQRDIPLFSVESKT